MAKLEDPKDPAKSDSPKKQGLLRREFVKLVGGTGVAATAQVLAGHKLAAAATTVPNAVLGSGKVVGPGPVAMSLRINGQPRKLSVEPRVTLLDALRNRLDLTGAKKVCDRGTCGACTVLVDGQPVYSCSMLAIEAEGREITTVEGIGTPEKMNAVQKAFVEHDAQQCGFCTPGFVVACTAYVRKHPNAS